MMCLLDTHSSLLRVRREIAIIQVFANLSEWAEGHGVALRLFIYVCRDCMSIYPCIALFMFTLLFAMLRSVQVQIVAPNFYSILSNVFSEPFSGIHMYIPGLVPFSKYCLSFLHLVSQHFIFGFYFLPLWYSPAVLVLSHISWIHVIRLSLWPWFKLRLWWKQRVVCSNALEH